MRILSIDQSYSSGWSYGSFEDNTLTLLESGYITVKKLKKDRPYHLHQELQKLFIEREIDVVLYELQYMANMHLITGILLSAIPPGIEQIGCSPSNIRKTLFDNGKLKKEDAQALFHLQYPQYERVQQEDELDSLMQMVGYTIKLMR